MKTITLTIIFLTAIQSCAYAEFYKYQASDGSIRITDDSSKIPSEQIERSRVVDVQTGGENSEKTTQANKRASNNANNIVEGDWVVISAKDDNRRIPDDTTKYLRYRFVKNKVFVDYPLKDDYDVPKQASCPFTTPDLKKPERIVFTCPNDNPLYVLAERQGDSLRLCFDRLVWPSDCGKVAEYNLKTMIRVKPDADPLNALIGTWSNGKNEFKTIAFGLRRDGRGIFGVAIMSTLLRWSREDYGILLKIAGGGKTEEMRLTYDIDSRTLIYKKPDGTNEVFLRISSKEPPDVEAESESKRRQEQTARAVSTKHQEDYHSRELLLEKLHSLASVTNPPSNEWRAYVRSGDSSWQLNVSLFYKKYFVEVPLIYKSMDKMSPGIHFEPCTIGEEPNIPTRFSLSKTNETTLRTWLSKRKQNFSQYAQHAENAWQVEGYLSNISIGPIEDRDTFLAIINYLINDLFRDSKPPFSIITYERNGGK